MELNKIYNMDCIEGMKLLPDNSIDSIVTDPPYEIGFMGKGWDSTGIANNVDMRKECLRVLKPGGHLLSFSATRTYHRMACAIEDAGFEVRDMIEWVYGSGFPKSHNIGVAVDKLQGNEREVSRVRTDGSGNATSENNMYDADHKFVATKVFNETKGTSEWEGWGTALKPAHEPICMARKPLAEKTVAENVLKYGTGGINIDESRVEGNEVSKDLGTKRTDNKDGVFESFDNNERKSGSGASSTLGRFPANLITDGSEEVRECFPETGKTGSGKEYKKEYDSTNSWKNTSKEINVTSFADSGNASRFFKSIIYTAKPAHEPICMARKPLAEKTVADNVLKYGTGGINIDESRVGTEEKLQPSSSTKMKFGGNAMLESKTMNDPDWIQNSNGRFPANLIHDNSEEVRECFPESKSIKSNRGGARNDGTTVFNKVPQNIEMNYECGFNDSGNASRFFKSIIYQSKASKSDRGEGNTHATVKPTALMEYLIKMVTKEGGIVLDPFTGSGTTLVAAKKNLYNFIGFELDKGYFNIANSRIENNKKFTS